MGILVDPPINITSFISDFKIKIQQQACTLQEIIGSIGNNDLQTAFDTTSKLRNIAGHNLARDDVFKNPDNLRILYEQQVNAILYLIQKKF